MGVTTHSFHGAPLITLPVRFGGLRQETIVMAVDTGATYTMIPWKIAQSLGSAPEKSGRHILITTASSTEEAPLVVISQVVCLGRIIDNLEVVVHDLPATSRIDGLLGLNALRALGIKIDFTTQTIQCDSF